MRLTQLGPIESEGFRGGRRRLVWVPEKSLVPTRVEKGHGVYEIWALSYHTAHSARQSSCQIRKENSACRTAKLKACCNPRTGFSHKSFGCDLKKGI